jgi:transcriptional regulator
MAKQVVCFHIDIDELEGKFKLGQNHSTDRIQRVVAALKQRPGENEQAIAELMNKFVR